MLCVSCKKLETSHNHKLCDTCLDRLRITNSQRKARLLAEGTCYICGKEPAAPKCKRCVACNAKDATNQRVKRETNRLENVCTQCGATLSPESSVLCERCLATKRVGQVNRRKSRKANGICAECDQPICSRSKRFCEKHWSIYNERSREYYFGGFRKSTIERDSYTCQICFDSNPNRLEVHHIDLDHTHNELDNLITLCGQCHRTISHLVYCKAPLNIFEFVKVHYLKI